MLRICRDAGELNIERFWGLPRWIQAAWVAFYAAEFDGDFLSPEERAQRARR